METIGNWLTPSLAGLMAFLGLLASSRAADDAFAVGGVIVFLGCVGYIFSAIGRHFDRPGTAH